MAGPLREEGGGVVKGRAIKEKRTNISTAIKLEGGGGGGGYALMARPLREELFFPASQRNTQKKLF